MSYMRDVDGNRLDDIAVLDRLNDVDGHTGLPDYAGRRSNPYDPVTNWYNWKPSNSRGIRAGLGKAAAGLARSHVLFIGDSATDAKITTTPPTYDRLHAWPLIMRDLLDVNGIPTGGDGVIRAASPGGVQDPRVVAVGGWNQTSSGYATVSANGATLTFTPVKPATTVEVWYARNGGPFTASMDGASSGSGYAAVTPDGANAWGKVTLTGASGQHTVVVTTTSTTATPIANINSYDDTGLVVQNVAYSGSAIIDWITYRLWYQLSGIVEYTQPQPRDGLFIGLGGNDVMLHGRTPTQMKADMVTLLDFWTQYQDTVLVVTNQPSVPDATWDEWAGNLYDLADDYDLPLVDFYGRLGSNATTIANGLHGDASHLNTAGHRMLGRQAATIVGT